MSNTRKVRRPGGDAERERRHMSWLNTADNGARLETAAKAAYADQGRGFWHTTLGAAPDFTRMAYITAAMIGQLPGGETRGVVARMVRTYNPARQAVVVIDDDGKLSAYKVRLVPRGDPGLN